MGGKNGEKQEFYQYKTPIKKINNIDINKIVVSNKVYFTGCKDAKKIRFLPKRSANRRDFDETKYMSFNNKR